MVTGDEQKRQVGGQRDLALVLFGVIPERFQRVGAQVLQQSMDRAVHQPQRVVPDHRGKAEDINSWLG